MKKTHLLAVVMLVCIAIGVRATDITSDINASTTWSPLGNPYIITNNITVEENVVLTIEPGVVVKFNLNRFMRVYGTLNANGATFTANEGVTKGFWNGIYTSYNSSSSSYPYANVNFTNCTVEYAQSLDAAKGQMTLQDCNISDLSEAVIISEFGTLNLANTSINSCKYPLKYNGSGVLNLGENVSFTNNENDYVLVDFSTISNTWEISDFGYPYVRNSAFTLNKNAKMTVNPGVYFQVRNATFWVYGTLEAIGEEDNPIIFDKTSDVNSWDGLQFVNLTEQDATILKYCHIQNAKYDSENYPAIYITDSYVEIDHCVLQNNSYNLRIQGNSNPIISNSLLRESFIESEYTRNVWIDLNADPQFINDSIFFNEKELRAIRINNATVKGTKHLKQINFANIENITYVMYGNSIIDENAQLTIDPGLVIKWYSSGSQLTVNGQLTAIGTVAKPIIFTTLADDSFGNPLDTQNDGTKTPAITSGGRIHLQGTAVSRLEHCKLHYGGYNTSTWSLSVYKNSVVDNCEIKNSYKGIRFTDNAVITNNFFDEISECAVSYQPKIGTPTLSGNTIGNVGLHGINLTGEVVDDVVQLKKMDFAGYTNIPFVLNSRLTVNKDKALNIEPGVVLKQTNFSSPSILVDGQLQAVGTEAEKIVFTSIHDDSQGGDTNNNGTTTIPGNNDWGGISFSSNSKEKSNILKNCMIAYSSQSYVDGSYADSPLAFSSCGGVVDSVSISFSNNHGIAVFGDANPEIKNTVFNNISKAPVYLDLFSNPTFGNNISLSNVGYTALYVRAGVIDGVVPKRSFAGYNPITYITDLTLTINNEVTIPAGLTFKGYGEWVVNGKLNVLGTAEEPVAFTTIEDDKYGTPKDTQSDGQQTIYNNGTFLTFNAASNDNSKVEHAVFRYAYRNPISLKNSNITINQCRFDNVNKGAISLVGTSAPIVTNNIFHDVNYPLTISAINFPAVNSDNIISGRTARAFRLENETLNQNAQLIKRSFAGIENMPYALGNYTIGTSAVLTIDPGVVMKFENNGNLYVRNGLKAIGGANIEDAVVFTSIYDDFYGGDTHADGAAVVPTESSWYGIYFYNEAVDADCILDNCVIRHAGYSSRAGVLASNASPTIHNTRFDKCYNAIMCENASFPLIQDCDFKAMNKSYGYAIWNKNTATTVESTNCWFGHESGPEHSSNPDGIGTRISNNVSYTPFATDLLKAELGDVSLNGDISAYDASLVLQHAVGNINLNTKQQAVADVSRDNTISSYDASLILKYNVGLNPNFSAQQMLMRKAPAATYHLLSYGTPQDVEDNAIVRLPLQLKAQDDISSIDISLNFNAHQLELIGLSKDNIANSIAFVRKDDVSDGVLKLSMASAYSLNLQDAVVYLDFKFKRNDIAESEITIQSVKANENEVEVEKPTITIQAKSPSGLMGISNDKLKVWVDADNIVLKLNQQMKNAQTQIALMDVSAKLIYSTVVNTMDNDKTYISFSAMGQLKQGVYLIRVISGDMIYTEKLMINK